MPTRAATRRHTALSAAIPSSSSRQWGSSSGGRPLRRLPRASTSVAARARGVRGGAKPTPSWRSPSIRSGRARPDGASPLRVRLRPGIEGCRPCELKGAAVAKIQGRRSPPRLHALQKKDKEAPASSAPALSPNASPRQLERKIGQLQDLKNSAQEVSSDDTLQMFHESILQSSHSLEEPHATLKRATDSSRLQCLSEDVAMLCCMNAQI
uniref:Uncharacterized protein n=1 Tax=Oryza meridionalis TaxID=40149 RepID=A0A0E0F3H7_9ORYZ